MPAVASAQIPMVPPVKEPPLKAPPPGRPNTIYHAIDKAPQVPSLDRKIHQQLLPAQIVAGRDWLPPLKAPPPPVPTMTGDTHYGKESRSETVGTGKNGNGGD